MVDYTIVYPSDSNSDDTATKYSSAIFMFLQNAIANIVSLKTSFHSIRHVSSIDKYRELYTILCHSIDTKMMRTNIDQVNNSLPDTYCFVNYLDVKLAVSRLKPRKSEAASGLSTDHFVYASDDCFAHISILCESYFTFAVKSSNAATTMCLVILPKNRRN